MLYMLYICNISFYISSRNAFLPSLDNPVFQFYTPQYHFILP